MSKIYSLSFILDKNGEISEDLISSNSLEQLDLYIKENFHDTKDVRKKYDSQISEFCLTYMKKIQRENWANHNNRTGSVVILEKNVSDGKITSIRPISVIYKGEHMISPTKAFRKIKEKLSDDDNLKRLFNEKKYLLSKNEMDLIRLYFGSKNDKYKENAIGFLVRRIKNDTKEETYYSLRHLTHLCDLKEKDKGKVRLTEVNSSSIKEELTLKTENNFVMYEQMTMDNLFKR